MRWLTNFSNEQLQQEPEYTLLKLDCHSWWISKMQSGREDILEERYAIKFCFKTGKNTTETYGMLHTAFRSSCMNRVWVFEWHKRFKEGRESVRDDERCDRSKEVRTPELIGQIMNFMDKDQKERRCHDSKEMVELINSNPAVLDALGTSGGVTVSELD